MEGPLKKPTGELDVSIPHLRSRSKECRNANFFRENLPAIKKLCAGLEKIKREGGALTEELERALQTLRNAEANPGRLYDYKTCLSVGDVWIHLEAVVAGAKTFATKNYKESDILCPLLKLTPRSLTPPSP